MWKRVIIVAISVVSALWLRREGNPIAQKIAQANRKTVQKLGGWRWPRMKSTKNKIAAADETRNNRPSE
jgi:hypothetical protein